MLLPRLLLLVPQRRMVVVLLLVLRLQLRLLLSKCYAMLLLLHGVCVGGLRRGVCEDG